LTDDKDANLSRTARTKNNLKMNMMRPGFLRGALRHLSILPRLIFTVRGWPHLLADAARRRGEPYQLHTKSGANCLIRPGTSDWWIFLEVFAFKIYQRVDADILRSETIIDIGANVGLFAIYAATLNPKVQIHAFEPFPKNLEQMKANLRLNQNPHVRIYADAVSDQSGGASLYFAPGDDSGCSLNAIQGQSVAVTTVHVNDLFKVCGIQKCDLLKMDCEGSELAILRAAQPEVLANIGAIIMEYHDPAEIPEILNILKQAGFECEILEQIKTLYASRR